MTATVRGNRRWRSALAAMVGAAFCHTPAFAEWSASLPAFKPCSLAYRPELPDRWRSVGLMMPFLQGQLDVGEFVYDGALPAMRATVYGLESGAVDLLITERETYHLSGPHDAPTQCNALGRKLHLPSRQWLSDKAVCIGELRVAAQSVRWWKTPGKNKHSTFHWFRTKTRLPWRSLFLSRSLDPPVIGDYTMTYFSTFAPMRETGLARLLDLCRAHAQHGSAEPLAATPTARDLMAIRNKAAEAERAQRISTLIPGLSHDACSRMSTVRWPKQFVMTAVITPARFNEAPYSSLIYYDGPRSHTQLAALFQGRPPVLKGLISLKPGVGYRIRRHLSGPATCDAVLPGIARPNWMAAAGCRCKGVIDRRSELGANAQTQILACPIAWQGQRVDWNWYTADGRPALFFEAGPSGGGFMLADYYDWLPGQTVPQSNFELPNICKAIESTRGAATAQPSRLSNPSCSDCHTTPW